MVENAALARVSERRYAAFADVDDTLTRGNSLSLFLGYCFDLPLWPADVLKDRRREAAELRAEGRAGASREHVCRQYYRLFRGVVTSDLKAAAAGWYRAARARDSFFVEPARRELEEHRASGASLVLVSGSFEELLRPLATELGASLLSTELEERAGTYTGEVSRLSIGEGKLRLVKEYLEAHPELSAADCYAYGDHASDVPFMAHVGHAVAVGDCAELRRIADQNGWRRIGQSSNGNVGIINEETNT